MGMDFCWISERFFSKMSPKWLQNAPPGLKIHLGAFKIDLWCYFCFKKCNPPMWITHFYRFLVNLDVFLGGIFDEKIVQTSSIFAMLFFSPFGEHFWWIFWCFLEPSGGQKSLRSRPRCDFLESVKTSKSAVESLRNQGSQVQRLMQK